MRVERKVARRVPVGSEGCREDVGQEGRPQRELVDATTAAIMMATVMPAMMAATTKTSGWRMEGKASHPAMDLPRRDPKIPSGRSRGFVQRSGWAA